MYNIIYKFSFTLLLFTMLRCTSIIAQEVHKYELDKVVISAGRVPVNMAGLTRSFSIIKSDEIKSTPAGSLQDVLQYSGGVDIQQRGINGVQADISIRGGSSEQTLILIDGIKVSDPQTAHHNLNLPVSMLNVERIEILKGQGARIHGPNAFSGVVNIVTKKATNNFLTLNMSGGENGYYSGALNAGFSAAGLSNHISISKNKSDGYRHNTNFETVNFNFNSAYRAQSAVVNLFFGYNDNQFGANGFYSSRFPNQWEHTKTKFANINAELGNETFSVSPKIFWRRNDDRYLLDYEDPSFYENNHQTDSYGFEIQTTLHSKLGVTAAGGEFTTDKIESSNLGNHARDKYGLFVEHNFALSQNLTLAAGGFLYNYSQIGWKLWPGIDIGYNVTPAIRLYASVGKAFRIPTFTELYYSSPSTEGNANLKHEKTINYEAGISWHNNFIQCSADLFRKEGTNLIDWTRSNDTEPWKANNIGRLNTNGFELNFAFKPVIIFTGLPVTSIRASYTYIDNNKNTAGFESKYLLNHLVHQFILSVNHNSVWGIKHSWIFRYEDRINLGDNFIVDISASKHIGKFEIFIKATNLFNKSYTDISGIPLPGRWIKTGVQFSTGRF